MNAYELGSYFLGDLELFLRGEPGEDRVEVYLGPGRTFLLNLNAATCIPLRTLGPCLRPACISGTWWCPAASRS